ncbi:response regulator [Neobacillus sedimentimangrovi]|uniref:response regulator n=1 Tax=Neobacillus sedimentimangrovi TaxID=2699460 RepID=UPI0013D6D29E|nr:response regulator [Neobacillus sedimentimangrovi]
MLKILIVDDEVLERKALSKIISNSKKDVMVIGEAPNGRIAIEMADQYRPDIIFMDIKMPGIDGVQAVKEIKKFAPDIRFIMVSAFNTFEYAKEVMQQGVKEYILKPSRKEDILSSLQRVADEILLDRRKKEEQEELRKNLERAVSIAQKEWVSSLLLSRVQDISLEEWGQLLGVEITSAYIMLFFIQRPGEAELSTAEKEEWYQWLKKTLDLMKTEHEFMVGPLTENQVPVLCLCKKTVERTSFRTNAQKIIDHMFQLFQKKSFKGNLRITVGNPYNQAYELTKSYHEAMEALKTLLKKSGRSYLFSGKLGANESQSVSGVLKVEKQLLDAIRQGDMNQVLLLFNSYIKGLKDHNKLERNQLKKSFDEMFVLISRMLHELGIPYETTPVMDESWETEVALEKGKNYILEAARHVQVWRNNHAKGMLHMAKEFIEAHFAESITLEQVAEYVELSPYYFSKLFKDRFGMTFIDYLTELRIKQAKMMIVDQGKSLKEICYSVGYKDPNYFSRVFKKHTGLSPTEYRKAIIYE